MTFELIQKVLAWKYEELIYNSSMSDAFVSILAGLCGMIGWGTPDFFANQASDKIGHFKTFFWSQLAGIAFLFVIVPFVGLEMSYTSLLLGYLLITSIFYSVGYLLFYKAFEIGNVSVVAATINVNVVISMLIAVVLRGQRLTPMQLFGVTLIFAGVTFVAVNIGDLKNKKVGLLSGVKETLVAALFFGVFWNLSEIISEQLGWLSTSLYHIYI